MGFATLVYDQHLTGLAMNHKQFIKAVYSFSYNVLASLKKFLFKKSQLLRSFQAIEHKLQECTTLIPIIEMRSRTIEYELALTRCMAQYQNDFFLKWYSELMPEQLGINKKPIFNAAKKLALRSEYPLAIDSHDHINAESTIEGLVRPTYFVRNCLDVLGEKINCLDLGTGAGGLIFEYLVNGIFAVGIDGSDFCSRYRIGYWPLLENNLFNCDITKPFSFQESDSQNNFSFQIITMWEVLEHIQETDLEPLFRNIHENLAPDGYFIGSVSRVDYRDKNSVPYHVTLQPKEWWKEKFYQHDLIMLENHPFNEYFFCRGVGKKFQDHHNYFTNPEDGFHFVAQKSK